MGGSWASILPLGPALGSMRSTGGGALDEVVLVAGGVHSIPSTKWTSVLMRLPADPHHWPHLALTVGGGPGCHRMEGRPQQNIRRGCLVHGTAFAAARAARILLLGRCVLLRPVLPLRLDLLGQGCFR